MLRRPIIRPKNVADGCLAGGSYTEVPRHVTLPYDEAQLKGMFKRFDANGDGRLSKEELRNAFKSLGSRAPGFRAFMALVRADQNRDGQINDDEFDILVKYASKIGYYIK
ncbi:Parvalbumin [Parasponia andersonii]|uniref:Parvalbumin n=1 Tax=Parasponia andersonii TaxID=3476 RepID=A0A2P5B0V2_PARAD|nr:Parvalbumin [Parasponia andersonii]